MTSIKSSYSTSGSGVGSYFYEYEYEYQISTSFRTSVNGSMSQMGSNAGSFTLMTNDGGVVKRVLGYGINLI